MSSFPPSERPAERPMTLVEAVLWVVSSVFLLAFLLQAAQKAMPVTKSDSAAFALCQLLGYLAILTALQRLYFPKTPLATIFATRAGSWYYYPIAVVLGAAILFPASAIYEAALARWPDTSQGQEIMGAFRELPRWRQVATGVGLVVTTPLVEEALFRGALFGTLSRRHAPSVVVVVTASLFALVHLQPQIFLPIGMVGAALAFMRVASGSMWPGVLLHMTFNGLSLYAQATGQGDSDQPTPVKLVIAGAVVSASMLALADYLRARNKDNGPHHHHEEEES
jgi:hypothetical protein